MKIPKATAVWDAAKRLLDPIQLHPLDPDRLKSASVGEEIALRSINFYGQVVKKTLQAFGVLLFLFIFRFEHYARTWYLSATLVLAPILILFCVTLWFSTARKILSPVSRDCSINSSKPGED